MKCPECKHKLHVKENKYLNFFYIGCKSCNFSWPKQCYPNGEFPTSKADCSSYKKNISSGGKTIPNFGE